MKNKKGNKNAASSGVTRQGIKITRKNVPQNIRLKLWINSGGRCQFRGCNKPLWYHSLTLSDGNFAEVAHIIGARPDAARGRKDSEDLQIAYENLMLLCSECHHLIDTEEEKYTTKLLQSWKKEHEERIEIQISYSGDIHRSTILICSIKIGDRYTPVHIDAIRNAMFPRFPTDLKGIKIEDQEFDRDSPPEVWQDFAERRIKKVIQYYLKEGGDDFKVKHLSIFGIAPMPFLIYLGKYIGDTIPADIYQSQRNISESNQTWSWKNTMDGDCDFIVNYPANIDLNKKVTLKLAVSDSLPPKKYPLICQNEENVYEITVHNPTPHFIKNARQIEVFSITFRRILNEIQSIHGEDCMIYLLPALPLCFAVECGRVLLPTKDSPMTLCEYYPKGGGYKPVLKLLK